jgi:JAB domain-containing protein similar to deubiquitination enzymes
MTSAGRRWTRAFVNRVRREVAAAQTQRLISEMQSTGLIFLGEWHSHPSGAGTPSSVRVFTEKVTVQAAPPVPTKQLRCEQEEEASVGFTHAQYRVLTGGIDHAVDVAGKLVAKAVVGSL